MADSVPTNDPSASAEVVPLHPTPKILNSVGKLIAVVGGTIAILGAIIATPLWVVSQVEASAEEVKQDTREIIAAHANSTHEAGVGKAEYREHTKNADERYDRILKRLDALGEKLYGPKTWKARIE